MSDREECSFCGKGKNKVAKLIAGPRVYICDECIALCVQIVAEDPKAVASGQVLVCFLDGRTYGCNIESEWAPFTHEGKDFEWCRASGSITSWRPLAVVAIRRRGTSWTPVIGASFPAEAKLTEAEARRVLVAYDGPNWP